MTHPPTLPPSLPPSLPAGIEAVNLEVKDIRTHAQNEMLLAEDTDREKAIAYLEELKAQVEVQQVEAARINKYQALFKVRVKERPAGIIAISSRPICLPEGQSLPSPPILPGLHHHSSGNSPPTLFPYPELVHSWARPSATT